jgi:hypothetical protein
VVNVLIIASVIALSFSGSGYFLMRFFRWVETPGFVTADLAEGITALALAGFTLAGALLVKGLRDWLHILMDVINHFYRRWEGIPYPWRPLEAVDVRAFETQQLIERRFKAALDALLADPDVTRLSVVAHSQGTIIAVDVLSLGALSRPERRELWDRLRRLEEIHLITLGSPLRHLYQHYFPRRYPPLWSGAWRGLRGVVRRWVNLFRADDFIGMDVETVNGWAGSPVNIHVGLGGHTGYWRQKEVHEVLLVQAGLDPSVYAALNNQASLPG